MDDDAVGFGIGCELIKVFIEVIDHIRADTMGALTPLAPIGQGFEGSGFAFEAAFGVVV